MRRFVICSLSIVSIMSLGCGKKNRKEEPAKSVDATPGTVPDEAVGTWVQGLEGIYRVERTHAADGKGTVKINLQGVDAFDAETALNFDDSPSPKRFIETVVKINKRSDDVDANVGDVSKCIYETLSQSEVQIECGDDYPAAFTEEAEVYSKE